MVKIACPKCNAKKYIRVGPENTDAPGASPCRYGAPVAIVLQYLNRDFRYYRGIACASDPGWRQGWRKGEVDDCQSLGSGAGLVRYPYFLPDTRHAPVGTVIPKRAPFPGSPVS